MKALILLLLMSGAVNAQGVEKTNEQKCADIAEAAADIMQARQQGIPLGKLYGAVTSDLHKRIILAAYEVPKFNMESFQLSAVAEFRDEAHRLCLVEAAGLRK